MWGSQRDLAFIWSHKPKGAASDEPGSPYSHGGLGVRDGSVCAQGAYYKKVTERKGHNLKKNISKNTVY